MDNKKETNQKVHITYNKNDLSVSSFISYLVSALYSQGIDAVSDKTGHKLESIMFSDIKLFLVIFSNSYASSLECLEELVKLLEFLQKEGHVVVPVFYDAVEKQQMKLFGEAFAMFEKSYSSDQVAEWWCVLAETMELKGHQYTDELREQSKFIEEIARAVFEKLNPTEQIGIHKVLPELDNLLCKQPWGFRSIGIFGASGIGKTTLAIAAFRRMSCGYDSTSRFIVKCNEKIDLFTEEDFKEIQMEKFDLNNQDAEPRYRRKRVLLVLDGVENTQDAKSFLDGFGQFGPGSLLIVTSIDRQVLEQCRVNEIYELKGLNHEDSLKLFTRCLYGQDVLEENLPKLSVREIERFNGNPSSIRLYAEEMKMKKTTDIDRNCHYSYIYTKRPLSCFQETSFSIALKQSLLCTASHNYLTDLEKLPKFDIPNLIWDLDSVQHNSLFDLSGLKLQSRAHFGQESVLSNHLHSEEIKSFQDYTSMESMLVTDQLEPTQVLNLCCCIEIKHFQEFVQTITELKFEGKILQWRLQTDPICPLCNAANETGSYFYFDFTFIWSIGTTISNQLHALVKLTTSKAIKVISNYSLWIERNHSLYRLYYRFNLCPQIHKILNMGDKKGDRKSISKPFKILLRTSSSH